MKYYCGLDVSLNSTAACVVNQDGTIIREAEVPSEPAAIAEWLKKLGLPMERVGLEAGGLSSWLCHELLALKWPVICIETRHAKAAMKAQQVKTDRNDARGLAHIMRTGWYKEVHIKSHDSQELRMLLHNRRFLLDKRLATDNQIRGTLRTFGLKVGEVTPAKYEQRIRELVGDNETSQACIFPMLEVRRVLIEQCKKLEKLILDAVKEDQVCELFMTIPGVGPLTALAFKTFVDRPERFQKSKAIGAALGLTPRKYASGEVDYDGHITGGLFDPKNCKNDGRGAPREKPLALGTLATGARHRPATARKTWLIPLSQVRLYVVSAPAWRADLSWLLAWTGSDPVASRWPFCAGAAHV
jgi:transposase